MEFEVNNTMYLMTETEGGVYFSRKDGEVLQEPDFDAIIPVTISYSMMNPDIGHFHIQAYSGDIGKVTNIFIPCSDEGIDIELSDEEASLFQVFLEALRFRLDEEDMEAFLPPRPVENPSLGERVIATCRRVIGWLERLIYGLFN